MYIELLNIKIKRVPAKGQVSSIEWLDKEIIYKPDESWFIESVLFKNGFRRLNIPNKNQEEMEKILETSKLQLLTNLLQIIPDIPVLESMISSIELQLSEPKDFYIHEDVPYSIAVKKEGFITIISNDK